jgi:hypothetical protein
MKLIAILMKMSKALIPKLLLYANYRPLKMSSYLSLMYLRKRRQSPMNMIEKPKLK